MSRIAEHGRRWVGVALVLACILVLCPGPLQAAQERLPLDGIGADGCNWNNCNVATLDDDPDAAGADWATATNSNTNHDGHFTFPTPSQALTVGADLQEFRVSLRKNATCGTGTPSARIELWEAGGSVRAGTEFDVTAANTGQQVASFTWNATEVTNAANVEIKVFGIMSGGSPATRCAVDLGAVEWNAEVSAGNTPPTVTITAPPDASSFNEGVSIDFTGTASDTEDGNISANLSWTSDLDGPIGSGASFSTGTLSVGLHTITASVTDSGGLSDQDQITVTVNNVAPTVTITAPPDASSFNDGDNVGFTGTATDPVDGDISGGLSWTSSLDGAIGSGASFSTTTLSVGSHTITATVTDPDDGGVTGQDQISVTINALANDVTPGIPSANIDSCNQITVSVTYSGDANNDSTTAFQHSPTGGAPWTAVTGCGSVGGPSPRICVDVNVVDDSTNYYRVDFADNDGVNGTDPSDPIGPYDTTPFCAEDATTIDTVHAEESTCTQITAIARFTGDANDDGTTRFEYKLTTSGSWTTACDAVTGPSPRQCIVPGLTASESYDVQVTFNDADTVAPDGDATPNSETVVPTGSPVTMSACNGTDDTAPTLLILAPVRDAVLGGSDKVKVQGFDPNLSTMERSVDSDNDLDLSSVGFTLNSNYDCGAPDCAVYEFDLDTTALGQGSHYFTVRATDAQGNVARLTRGFRVNNSGANAAGNALLLRRTKGSQLCIDCHNLPTHSSQSTSNKYGNWAVECLDCHTPHQTKNISLIREEIRTPASDKRPVRFEVTTGAVADSSTLPSASYVNEDNDTQADGPCQVCHTRTSAPGGGPARWRNSGNADTHLTSGATTRCTDCHTHDVGFSGAGGACNSCHHAPPSIGKHGTHDEVWDSTAGNTATSYSDTGSHASATQYGFACAKCHSGGHLNDTTNNPTHDGSLANPFEVEIIYDATANPQNPAGTYGGTYNANQDQGPDTRYWSWSDGTCADLYCHSNASPLDGSASFATVTWDQVATLDCTSCHDTQARGDSGQLVDLSAAHGTHIQSTSGETSSYGFKCDECHALTITDNPNDPWNLAAADLGNKAIHVDGDKDVFFSSTATAADSVNQSAAAYDDVAYTCSDLYCHSQGTTTSSPFPAPFVPGLTWNAGVSTCESCHGGDAGATNKISPSNAHGAHMDQVAYLALNLECARCHDNTLDAASDTTITGYTFHVNGGRDVAMSEGGTYDDAFGCSSAYCHSNGTETLDFVNPPSWDSGTTLNNDCKQCHGTEGGSIAGEPRYPNNQGSTDTRNSHPEHVLAAADCQSCHTGTVDGAGALLAAGLHLDQSRDVAANDACVGAGDPYPCCTGAGAGTCTVETYDEANETCTNACHGAGNPQWGGNALICLDCHTGVEADNVLGDGSPNAVDDEWTLNAAGGGHGGARGGTMTSLLGGCDYCHQLDAGHTPTDVTNPYRLRFSTTDNQLCLECHGGGPDGSLDNGISANSEGTGLTALDSSLDVDTAHFGAKHVAGEGGELCWDCHDPHGVPSNILMVKSQVSQLSDAYGVPGTTVTVDFTDNATPGQAVGRFTEQTNTPRTGICQACHDPNKPGTDSTKYWRNDGTDDPDGQGGAAPVASVHNAGVLCSTCHLHTDNFKGAANDCLDCHAQTGDAGVGGTNNRRPVEADFGKNSHHLGASQDSTGAALFTQPNMGGALTNFDCVVCHAEGREDAGEVTTEGQPHQDGIINLRDTDSATIYYDYDKDSIGGAAGTWMSGNTTWETQTSERLDPFCLSCHDTDGASATYNDGTNEGLGFVGSAGNPFADSAITNEYDQQSRGAVVNIRNKVDAYVNDANVSITPIDREGGGEPRTTDGRPDPTQGIYSRHAIRGDGSYGSGSVYGSSQIFANRWASRPSGSWNDTSLMGCADCHTTDGANDTDGNAHGSNTEYLLKNSDGLAAAEPDFDVRNADLSQINCYKCHNWQWYARERNQEHTDNNSDWVFTADQTGDANRRSSDGNIYGVPCSNCHGGVGWGSIHGTSDTFTINQGPGQRQAYRFMNGASLRYYDPNGWSTGTFTCYTLADGEVAGDSWGACAQHDPGNGKTYDRTSVSTGAGPVQRPIQY